MKRFVFLFLSIMSVMVSAKAQTFTQHLQQNQAGKGKVSVSQSREIDALVNGNVTRSATLTEAQGQTTKKNINAIQKTSVQATTTTAAKTASGKHETTAKATAGKNDSLEKARAHEQEEERLKAQKAKENAVEEALALQRRIAACLLYTSPSPRD